MPPVKRQSEQSRLRMVVVAALILLSGAGLALLILTLLYRQLDRPPLQHIDELLQLRLHAMASPAVTRVMLWLTRVGAIKTFAPSVAILAGVLLLRGRHSDALLLGGAILGAFVLNESLKLHFHRMRPQVPWSIGDEHTFSFPSGHSLFAVVLYGSLAYIALPHLRSRLLRVLVVLAALLMPACIGISRIYLGMHFPTDVLAGWLTGLLWLGVVIMIARLWPGYFASSTQPADDFP